MLKKEVMMFTPQFRNDGTPPPCPLPTARPLAPLQKNTCQAPTLPAWRAHYSPEVGGYFRMPQFAKHSVTQSSFKEQLYSTSGNSIYKVQGKQKGLMVANATIRVVAISEIWFSDKEHNDTYTIEVSCTNWGDQKKQLEIPAWDFKKAYETVHRKYPDVFYQLSQYDPAIEGYLTDVYNESKAKMVRHSYSAFSGWSDIRGEIAYRIGKAPEFSTCELPEIASTDATAVFKAGTGFLTVGKEETPMRILWLYAHLGYILFWLKQAASASMFVLYLRGQTGSLKTSVTRELGNVFDTNRDHATIRMTSTSASITKMLATGMDCVKVIDDFSNSSFTDARNSERNAETIIRAVGDDELPSKMDYASNFSRMQHKTVRAAVVLTGEEKLSLGASSLLRVIELPIDEKTFDGAALRRYQENPSILRRYFALFVQYLSQKGPEISASYPSLLSVYRDTYRDLTKDKRYVDDAVLLQISLDIVVDFAMECGIPFKADEIASFRNAIVSAINFNSSQIRAQRPEVLFLKALKSSLNTDTQYMVADCEDDYVGHETDYVGFWESKDGDEPLLYLRAEDAMELVRNYYKKMNDPWYTKSATIKERLLTLGLSKGHLAKKGQGGNQYLVRAKKGARKRMLVLIISAIKQYLKGDN